jgi:adenine-specific DNA-methyltransferase
MAKKLTKSAATKTIVALKHSEAKRKNIPTAELESVMKAEQQSPLRVAYERRNRDLDPQLVWRGKDEQDWSDLVVHAPPLFIQEKVQPKVLIDDLRHRASADRMARELLERAEKGLLGPQIDLFADFNGLPDTDAKTEFYQHDAHWSNRMILGDSLQVMASLTEREGLRGQVQCIYIDPPYGIKFNSNFQWSTTSRDVKDGNVTNITREPEQVKAFRDTWRDGIHSYLTYLRDRMTACRDLLHETGSIFVQIGDDNLHRIKALLDEVFGDKNAVVAIPIKKKGGQKSSLLDPVNDYLLWYAKNKDATKYRQLYEPLQLDEELAKTFRLVEFADGRIVPLRDLKNPNGLDVDYSRIPKQVYDDFPGVKILQSDPLTVGGFRKNQSLKYVFRGREFDPGVTRNLCWKHTAQDPGGGRSGLDRLAFADRLLVGQNQLRLKRFIEDFGRTALSNWWDGLGGASNPIYVVQTNPEIVQRCVLMTTDPGDLVLDPTCGSGTTAYVAEQWGRRWITIDTSRVALALARARIMGTRYPFYLLADSREGQLKEADVMRTEPSTAPAHNTLRQGFVYERVPHITSSVVANNAEIDVIWEKFQSRLEPLRQQLNKALKQKWEDWEIPREAEEQWSKEAKDAHARWWEQRLARQKEIDASIATKAEFEYLYDKPYEDKKKVRVAGPFTVESLSPHRVMTVGADDELIDPAASRDRERADAPQDFAQMILENLRSAGVQQAHKEDKITFTSLTPWPGKYICAEGRYADADGSEKRAGIFIGPEFGTVSRQDLVLASREAGDANFDVVIACAFNYEAHASEFDKLGRIRVLKARMNAELHMAGDLKNTGKGNLFVIFGEPDIEIIPDADTNGAQIKVKIRGVDVFHPQSGEVRSDGAEGIACWFIDTDYNEESFFIRHAYFLGQNDPYKALKTTLKAEINEEAWASLNSDTSRPFPKPAGGKIAVKVINHLGDEVMKVFKVK